MINRIKVRQQQLNSQSLNEYCKGNTKLALELKRKENYIKNNYSKIISKERK